MTAAPGKWKIAVDRGGTFTDVVGVDPEGFYHFVKVLSNSTEYTEPSIAGIKALMGLGPNDPIPINDIETLRFATTVATNALLERKGSRVALFITSGFEDLIEIGYQNRPEIFTLCVRKHGKLYHESYGVNERIDSHGNIVKDLDAEGLKAAAMKAKAAGMDVSAVVFMHAWCNPDHELIAEKILHMAGLTTVFLSHRSINRIKIVTRGQSTVLDAYLSVILDNYITGITNALNTSGVQFMLSSGRLAPASRFTGKDAILSGPAAGAIAVAKVAADNEIAGLIGFDMGGTSTDVCRFDGKVEMIYERVLAGVEFQSHSLSVTSVAAGGSSALWFDGQKMRVGPESTGSMPGPLSYGFGGKLSITDANLFVGRVSSEFYPETFGRDRHSPLDAGIVEEAFKSLTADINSALGTTMTPVEVANGYIKVANELMASAIKEISVSRGYDCRKYALLCFGGAAGQHACAVAELLEIDTIICHPLGSVLSAYGIGVAAPAESSEQTVLKPLNESTYERLKDVYVRMEEALQAGATSEQAFDRTIELRVTGSEYPFTIPFGSIDDITTYFMDQHSRHYGFLPTSENLEIVSIKVEAESPSICFPPVRFNTGNTSTTVSPLKRKEIYFNSTAITTPVYDSQVLPSDFTLNGPALITGTYTTLVLEQGFYAQKNEKGIIFIKKDESSGSRKPEAARRMAGIRAPDPVLLEVFNNVFKSIGTEMGFTLRNTAHSVNIKERLDFSCALFDSGGELVANAPHIPVHIGSMAQTVKSLIKKKKNMISSGDVYMTNDPYGGGSHLPDITVIYPVFSKSGKILFITAARGHHSDIGGKTPGSMPPDATNLHEEGIVFDAFPVVKDGYFLEDEILKALTRPPYPARNAQENLQDIKAQIAACKKGASEMLMVMEKYGTNTVIAYMKHIRANATFEVKKALTLLLKGNAQYSTSFTDTLDDGTAIKVAIDVQAGTRPPETVRAVIDFTGSSRQHERDNLNAPLPVTMSSVLYVLRTLAGTEIPLNGGFLAPITVKAPRGSILNPVYPAAVSAGNVETSQRIVDVLLGALQVSGASQGTMNNLLFKTKGYPSYYETIGGGAGATPGCPGASGVQVHMTNTRSTDPEILEFNNADVRVSRFTLRQGSGGEGLYRGGDGIIREILFLTGANVTILSERRKIPPYGQAGGCAGKCGRNILKHADGTITELPHRVNVTVQAGESIIIKTPGGGGYGLKGD